MTNMSNQATGRLRSINTKLLSILAAGAIMFCATSSRADSDADKSDQNSVAGTWISKEAGGSMLVTFLSDGRMILSTTINILTGNGPGGSSELASTSHGEWSRASNRTFVTTAYSILSSPIVGFTHLVKLNGTYTLNKTSDELTLVSPMVSVFFPDGTPQFPPFPGAVTHFRRVVAGE
jgi:hypothetical protein